MSFQLLHIPEVRHVGTLRAETRTARASLEAFLLSVSMDPEEWSSIARCAGETWTLRNPEARYLDVHALSDAETAQIMSWAAAEGYAAPCELWRVWHYDDEADDFRYMRFGSESEALREADDEPQDEYPTEDGMQIDRVPGHLLTEQGMAALERWPDATDAIHGCIILWVREVLSKDRPDCVGVWWEDDYDPQSLSCPRGGILPEKLCLFDVEDQLGNRPPACFPAGVPAHEEGRLAP